MTLSSSDAVDEANGQVVDFGTQMIITWGQRVGFDFSLKSTIMLLCIPNVFNSEIHLYIHFNITLTVGHAIPNCITS